MENSAEQQNSQQCPSSEVKKDKAQASSSAREPSEYENVNCKRDLEDELKFEEGERKRSRDDASLPGSYQTILLGNNSYANLKAESPSLKGGSSKSDSIATSQKNMTDTRTPNSVTIHENNSSRTAPFDMTMTSESAKIERPSNYFYGPQIVANSPSSYFPPEQKNEKNSDMDKTPEVGRSLYVETAYPSPAPSQWSWNDFRPYSNMFLYPNTQQSNLNQDGYTKAPPAYVFGQQFQNSTHACPLIMQYPVPYVFPSSLGFPNLSKDSRNQFTFLPEYKTKYFPQFDNKPSEKSPALHPTQENKATARRQDPITEGKPVVSMISSDSRKTFDSWLTSTEMTEEKFAAVSSPFLRKLLFIVEQEDTQHLCSWTRSGRSFVVWHPIRFENEVLPQYYKHSNFSSFVRQLNQYGFHKLHPEVWEFGHPLFIRNRIDLIVRICRRPSRRLKRQQTDSSQIESRTGEVSEHGSHQHSDNEQFLDSGLSPAMSAIDNDESTLEAMESFIEPSFEEDKEGRKDSQNVSKDRSNESTPLFSPTYQSHIDSIEPVNPSKEKATEMTQLQRTAADLPCVLRILENIYSRLSTIEEEVRQMQTKIESFQEILKTLSLRSQAASMTESQKIQHEMK